MYYTQENVMECLLFLHIIFLYFGSYSTGILIHSLLFFSQGLASLIGHLKKSVKDHSRRSHETMVSIELQNLSKLI